MIKGKTASEYPLLINAPVMGMLEILKDQGTVIDDPKWQEKVLVSVDGNLSAETGVVSVKNVKVNFDGTLKEWMV